MNPWLEAILEIIKLSIPALIVFFTVYYLLKNYLDKQYQLRLLDLREEAREHSIPLKFQAYERLSLLCERIAIPNLILRIRAKGMDADTLRNAMLVAIQQEFDHNISQQVYVSHNLWRIIKLARQEMQHIIQTSITEVPTEGPSDDYVDIMIRKFNNLETNPVDKAQVAIKKEASYLM